uniref:Uncharacterized protein n=1 Tax=Arundo donax TaxID=35708 RepID=A0A0A9CV09_ARUDO
MAHLSSNYAASLVLPSATDELTFQDFYDKQSCRL